ncbi:flagellar hook-associated family protein [Microvirga rosea]|uniref:flagellar hook-associated family protein n=1 Tax=Microvirga rosea TaxID=2715425 RepID=UPI001D09CC67|nr:flagellar hook-associated family protein [Microvirga rosea]MCB8823472.1 flagellar hook-associated family protein [Microvirga rosea]
MKTTFISTVSLWNSPRNALSKMQTDLAKANQEIATGRYADVGLELGYRAGHGISLRQERAELDALIDGNGTVSVRLNVTKSSLTNIRTTAETYLNSLLSLPPLERGAETVRDSAALNLRALTSELNKSTGGQYIFAGTNTKEKPVTEYKVGSPAKTAVDGAFMTAFGISQTDPNVFNISAADMKTFLNSAAFNDLFDGPAWSDWSSASDQNIESKISTTEKIDTSTNANEVAMRKLAKAYTIASDLGIAGMRTETQQAVVEKVIEILGQVTNGLVEIQAKLGDAETKVKSANDRMDVQRKVIDEGIGRLEEVDPAEAKTRVDALTTQIQMSYSLTSQLRQLSLLNYL